MLNSSAPTPETVWDRCLRVIRENISALTYKTWFEPIKPVQLEDDQLTIQVPSQFFYEWLEEHYYTLIQRSLENVIGPKAKLVYRAMAEDDPGRKLQQQTMDVALPEPPPIAAPPSMRPAPVIDRTHSRGVWKAPNYSVLNPRYTFETFVKGEESNAFACAACVAVANNPGKTTFNPLVIYGGVGLGKTHLIQAVGNYILAHNPAKRVLYTSSDQFTIEFVEAIQNDKVREFTNFYRSVDVLMVDDIQFFSGKEKTQDNFFHTFNALQQFGKQIILTCDRSPKELKGVDDRLVSRFQCGLTTDVQPPDYETRVAILQMKSAEDGIELPSDVIEYLARNITSNIRELEGCYISLLAHCSLEGKEFSVDLAREVLHNVASIKKSQITIQDIQKVVAGHYKITEDLLLAKTRKQEIAFARQVAMFLCKELTGNSLKTIGMHFGGRDHSTVIHACKTIEEMVSKNAHLLSDVESIRRQLNFMSQ